MRPGPIRRQTALPIMDPSRRPPLDERGNIAHRVGGRAVTTDALLGARQLPARRTGSGP
jgi:hypothetical protein